ncbi:hypothetical protein niasHT_027542 [Heterodera trifolii]|uniref:Uncharacterized protein n=1 Tax=Heterodera trifolii TaxID=157864 RepID=A0ABD2K539_9BILA
MSFFGSLFVLLFLFPLLFLIRRSSTDGQFVLWNAPTLPTADIFFSPCTFPMVYPFESQTHRRKHIHSPLDNDSLCHVNSHLPFICDLHRALSASAEDVLRLARVHQKHAALLYDNALSSPIFVVLIVRQLSQPISTTSITRNSTEFGCLFRLPCGTMSAEMVQKFVRSTKVFMRVSGTTKGQVGGDNWQWHKKGSNCPPSLPIRHWHSPLPIQLYAHVLLNRWSELRRRELGAHCPMVLAIDPFAFILVLLEGLTTNPKRISSVTLHTDNPTLFPFLVNAQNECSNLLMQGNRLVDVLIDLTNRVGFAIRDFHSTKGKLRQHTVPNWAWIMAFVALSAALLALVTEWAVVRRVRTKKMRTIEFVGTKSVIKSKTHIIF